MQKGMRAPFSRNRIVGAKGEYFIEPSKQEQVRDRGAKKVPFDGFPDDESKPWTMVLNYQPPKLLILRKAWIRIPKPSIIKAESGTLWILPS